LKRIQDKHKQAKRVGYLGSKLDELLAFKAEMVEKIEDTVTFIEQNCFDRRLENSILFLAGYGGDENSREDIGFNGSDSRFGHYLAGRLQSYENLTVKQARTALNMMQKYSKTQLEPNGYWLPTAWEDISHQYRESKIEGDPPGSRIVLKRDEEQGTYMAVYNAGEGYFGDSFDTFGEEDIWKEGGGWGGFSFRTTEELLPAIAESIGDGYVWYVDPDIEVAYYLWQQEQKAGNR
ncbi:MAG: hypothetical protein F6K17_27865, partial [Okeania sp. SIO3C4]|nr:hypothetical protein [Okeania sp. SIO3C4]